MSGEDDYVCIHEWVYSSEVIATNPPIYRKICKLCGKQEEEHGTYYNANEYDELVEKFRKKNE